MADGKRSVSDQWISALEAVRLYHRLFTVEDYTARAQLLDLAGDQLVRTRCVHWAEHAEGVAPLLVDDLEIGSGFWRAYLGGQHQADWDRGFFSLQTYSVHDGYSDTRAHGVEFCSTDVVSYHARITGRSLPGAVPVALPPPVVVPPGKPSRSTAVTPTEADAWYDSLAPADRALGLRKLHKRLQDDHPGRHAPRKLVEFYVKDRPAGRPKGSV